jgi:hypothetical protein
MLGSLLWAMLSGATVRCSGGSFQDDDDTDRNRPPVASDSFLETRLGSAVSDRMQATDPDGDRLTFRVTSGPASGSLGRLDDNGYFTYVPAVPGSDQFSFRANDGRLDSNTARVVIRVSALGGAAGAEKPAAAAGVATVLADPVTVDGLLVVWAGAEPVL